MQLSSIDCMGKVYKLMFSEFSGLYFRLDYIRVF